MKSRLRSAFETEMTLGKARFGEKDFKAAFRHFERAHVLGQFYVWPHVRTHLWMFMIGVRTGDLNEIAGQLLRLPLGLIGSAMGKVPKGNTGGANVKLTSRMSIPKDLQDLLDEGDRDQ